MERLKNIVKRIDNFYDEILLYFVGRIEKPLDVLIKYLLIPAALFLVPLVAIYPLTLPAKKPPQERVTRLTEALADSLKLIEEIKAEVENGTALAAKLQADIKTYDEVAKLKQAEVESVAQLLRGEIQKESRQSFWEDVGINAFFYLLGIASPTLSRLLSRIFSRNAPQNGNTPATP